MHFFFFFLYLTLKNSNSSAPINVTATRNGAHYIIYGSHYSLIIGVESVFGKLLDPVDYIHFGILKFNTTVSEC